MSTPLEGAAEQDAPAASPRRRPRLLIVAYAFPPAGGITVMRALSLAKYFPACGIDVHVLAARNPAVPVRDPGLLAHVPPSVSIHRTFTPELPFYLRKRLWERVAGGGSSVETDSTAPPPPRWKSALAEAARRIFCPDPQVVWTPFAVAAARRIIRRHQIDAVLVTAPPFSVFLIGNALKRAFPHLRLISDFRDEWLRFYLTDFEFLRSDAIRRRAEQIERETVRLSDLVVAVTASSLREIRSRYPAEPDSKFALVHNGYDPDALKPLFAQREDAPRPKREKVVITHIGTAYSTASPAFYFQALDGLPDAIRSRIETRFIGRISETEQRLLARRGESVRLLGFLPQAEALRHIADTDYLLLTMTNEFSLPGKLFEYLASGKPIIALSPCGGEVDRLIAETNAGWCVPHDDPQAVRRVLEEAVRHALQGTVAFRTRRDIVARYERPRLVAEYARILRERLFPEAPPADAID
ncbi:MAG: glycosyltransferase [Bryobacteraceae bacterium]